VESSDLTGSVDSCSPQTVTRMATRTLGRILAVGIVLVFSGACGTPLPPTSGVPSPPQVYCSPDVSAQICEPAAGVAIAAVAVPGRAVTDVWITRGLLCPTQGCLFDPTAHAVNPTPPTGGTWVADAEIAFGATHQHAGLQIARVGGDLVPFLIGYRVPSAGWCPEGCAGPSTTGQAS
jgi:hypothetical protein